MEIIYKKIDELNEYENNPRINDEAVEIVANSIREFGFKVPIVIDSNNVIITGHTRLKAARELEFTEVPCIVADDLTEEQVRAFRLADNKVAEFSYWDYEKLIQEAKEIKYSDLKEFGFTKEEIEETNEVLDFMDFFTDEIEKKEKDDEEDAEEEVIRCPECGSEDIELL